MLLYTKDADVVITIVSPFIMLYAENRFTVHGIKLNISRQ